MVDSIRLSVAIQKSGHLSKASINLLSQLGITLDIEERVLITSSTNAPIDIFRVRHDDIAKLVMEGFVDVGILGENILHEVFLERKRRAEKIDFSIIKKLNFGTCRLSIAAPKKMIIDNLIVLNNKKIATSYPRTLEKFLADNNISAHIITLSGSVEIAPNAGFSDAVCDIVSTGCTLKSNNLHEGIIILKSKAAIIKRTGFFTPEKLKLIHELFK